MTESDVELSVVPDVIGRGGCKTCAEHSVEKRVKISCFDIRCNSEGFRVVSAMFRPHRQKGETPFQDVKHVLGDLPRYLRWLLLRGTIGEGNCVSDVFEILP
jgi:hypothetical protein